MMAVQVISSAVTALTAGLFVLIVRNLQGDNLNYGGEENSNEFLSQAILEELAADVVVVPKENEIDYELLEESLKLIDSVEDDYGESEDMKLTAGEASKVEVKIVESTNLSGINEGQSDLTIEATHNIKNAGQHRPYTLSLHFMPRPREKPIPWTQCKLQVEWPLPKNVFVDVWSLRRLAPFTIDHYPSHVLNPSSIVAGIPSWSVKPRHPDLEAGSYGAKARPFILAADVPFRYDRESEGSRIEGGKLVHVNAPWNLDLHVPDLMIRYQPAVKGSLFQKHARKAAFLPAPKLHFKCQSHEPEEDFHVEWQLNRLRPLQISLPVGSATATVSHATMASVLFSSLFLLTVLFKF